MREKAKDIYVEEVMTKAPKTGRPEMSAQAAAKLMREEKVGSLVIIEDGSAVGILTEKDLMEKIVAEGKSPAKVKVQNVMSSPVVTVGPKESVAAAAKKMSSMKLRRLPVVEQGRLVGILTENDILRLSPSLIELTREYARLGACGPIGGAPSLTPGYCENCGAYSEELMLQDGEMLCRDCLEQTRAVEEG
jgi:CBS domain-containing protein